MMWIVICGLTYTQLNSTQLKPVENRLSNRFDNRLYRVYKHIFNRLSNPFHNQFDNRLYRVYRWLSI